MSDDHVETKKENVNEKIGPNGALRREAVGDDGDLFLVNMLTAYDLLNIRVLRRRELGKF